MMEFALALFSNLKSAAHSLLFVVGIGSFFALFYLSVNEAWRQVRPYLAGYILGVGCLPALSVIPSVDDLWKVRIGLIKLELASPENLKGAAEVIERIGRKLECKYIGCDEEKK
jgi:hypothetical protein